MTEYVMAVTGIWHSNADFEAHSLPADNTDAFVGTYPYLETIDADTSYVQAVTRTVAGGNFTGYTVPAWTAPGPVVGARLEFQGKHGAATNQRVHFQWDGPTAYSHINADWTTYRVPGVWELLTEELLAADDVYGELPILAADLATGRVEVSASYDAFPYFLSALRLVIITAGTPKNQQIQRADGLGRGGVPLARGGGTRQAHTARGAY